MWLRIITLLKESSSESLCNALFKLKKLTEKQQIYSDPPPGKISAHMSSVSFVSLGTETLLISFCYQWPEKPIATSRADTTETCSYAGYASELTASITSYI